MYIYIYIYVYTPRASRALPLSGLPKADGAGEAAWPARVLWICLLQELGCGQRTAFVCALMILVVIRL